MQNKKFFHYFILVIVPLLIVTGCPGLADYDIDLPGNYSVIRTSAHQVKIAPRMSDIMWGADVIPTKVIEVAWSENYILAKQLGVMKDPNSSNGHMIPNKDDVNFWILDYKSGEVFGPLDHEDFIQKKNELGISEEVELKKVEDLL